MNKFFDILNDILLKKSGGNLHEHNAFHSIMSPFMLARFFSMRDDFIEYADKINEWNNKQTLTPAQIYQWAYHTVPKQRSGYISYISKPKKKKKKEDKKD